jgi:gluconate 5-dehydrogenase
MFSLEKERCVVTGGGSGLGLAAAHAMLKCEAEKVVIVGRPASKEKMRQAASDLGDRACYICHDVTDLDGSMGLAEQVKALCGGPATVLVNNAGIHLKKPALETSVPEFQKVLDVHLLASFALTRAFAPAMVEREHGSIIFITSMAAIYGLPQVVAYSAAKSALAGITRQLATELSPHNVRVNSIAPGFISTPMMHAAVDKDPERKAKILGRTPSQQFGTPEDIGNAVVYLASPAARFVTGTQLVVDGGISIGF